MRYYLTGTQLKRYKRLRCEQWLSELILQLYMTNDAEPSDRSVSVT